MTVYVDGSHIPAKVRQHDSTWCHLFADSQEELHAFAQRLGLKRSHFQDGKSRDDGTPASHRHYDVTAGKRERTVAFGAQEVHWRATPRIMRDQDARAQPAEAMAEEARLHRWENTGHLLKSCWECDTAASCECDQDDQRVAEYRPTVRAASAQRLTVAGITPHDPGLVAIRAWNAALGLNATAPAARHRRAGGTT